MRKLTIIIHTRLFLVTCVLTGGFAHLSCADQSPFQGTVGLVVKGAKPLTLAVQDEVLYWTEWTDDETGSLVFLVSNGGNKRTLSTPLEGKAVVMRVDATDVYVATLTAGGVSRLYRVPGDGEDSTPEMLLFPTTQSISTDLALTSDAVFWRRELKSTDSTMGTCSIERVSKAGFPDDTPTVLLNRTFGGFNTQEATCRFAVNEDSIIFIDEFLLNRCPIGDCAGSSIQPISDNVSIPDVSALFADDPIISRAPLVVSDYFCWPAGDQVLCQPLNGGPSGATGSSTQSIADFVADDKELYWTSFSPADGLFRNSIDPFLNDIKQIAGEKDGNPQRIAIDDRFVYWSEEVEFSSGIFRKKR